MRECHIISFVDITNILKYAVQHIGIPTNLTNLSQLNIQPNHFPGLYTNVVDEIFLIIIQFGADAVIALWRFSFTGFQIPLLFLEGFVIFQSGLSF